MPSTSRTASTRRRSSPRCAWAARARARVASVFAACADGGVRRQMGHLLGRHRLMSFIAKDEAVDAAIGNAGLAALYAVLARDLDVVEAKTPDDIYKTHLVGGRAR